jgi:hypothetical protein
MAAMIDLIKDNHMLVLAVLLGIGFYIPLREIWKHWKERDW